MTEIWSFRNNNEEGFQSCILFVILLQRSGYDRCMVADGMQSRHIITKAVNSIGRIMDHL
jgi:hypothetical protein